jgi:hypothetical protein
MGMYDEVYCYAALPDGRDSIADPSSTFERLTQATERSSIELFVVVFFIEQRKRRLDEIAAGN